MTADSRRTRVEPPLVMADLRVGVGKTAMIAFIAETGGLLPTRTDIRAQPLRGPVAASDSSFGKETTILGQLLQSNPPVRGFL
jgi:hypothetical protein